MDDAFWEGYAADAESNYNEEFAKFIRDLVTSLRCSSVLEVGCNAGNDLRLFPESVEVNGLDSNQKIIEIAKRRLPSFNFKAGSVTGLPYGDSSIDLVFTHGFLNYLEDGKVESGTDEMLRVARRYVVNCELAGEDSILDEGTGRRGRDMYRRWLGRRVKIISNVEMHEEIDPERPRFVLVRKI